MSVTTLEEVFLRVANGTADAASRREIQDIAAQHHRSFSRSASAVVVDAAVDKVTCLTARFCAVGDFGRSASHNSSPIVLMDWFLCFPRRRRFGPYMFRLNPMLRSKDRLYSTCHLLRRYWLSTVSRILNYPKCPAR